MSNKTYDILKKIAQVWIPAISTTYFSLASIWNLPYSEEIVGTLAALDACMGILLGISTAKYNRTELGSEE